MARNSTNKQIVPDPTKFPNGISGVASQVHALGLVGVFDLFQHDVSELTMKVEIRDLQ
jgi:hypothetical protein